MAATRLLKEPLSRRTEFCAVNDLIPIPRPLRIRSVLQCTWIHFTPTQACRFSHAWLVPCSHSSFRKSSSQPTYWVFPCTGFCAEHFKAGYLWILVIREELEPPVFHKWRGKCLTNTSLGYSAGKTGSRDSVFRRTWAPAHHALPFSELA